MEFITHLDRKVHRTGIGAAFIFRNLSSATLGLPPVTLFSVLSGAVKFYPGSRRQRVFHIELAATSDWAVDAKVHAWHPTPIIVVPFVNVEGERGDLDGVFGDGWLVLCCGSRR